MRTAHGDPIALTHIVPRVSTRNACCRAEGCRILNIGLCTLAAMLAVLDAMDKSVLWSQSGATNVAPPVLITSVVCAAFIANALHETVVNGSCKRIISEQPGSTSKWHRLQTFRRHVGRLLLGTSVGVVLFVLIVWLSRSQSSEHLDDLHPSLPCDFLSTFRTHKPARTKFLHIIPIAEGEPPISSNRTWCDEMLRLERQEGFVLCMHGVQHMARWANGTLLREFEHLAIDQARLKITHGIDVWREAFGGPPSHFSFPGAWGSAELVEMLKSEFGFMHVRSLAEGLLQRVYHCDDSFCGDAAFACRSWALDIF